MAVLDKDDVAVGVGCIAVAVLVVLIFVGMFVGVPWLTGLGIHAFCSASRLC